MRIISNFKDYYDFSGFGVHDSDYRDTVYLRKPELKITDAVLEYSGIRRYHHSQYGYKITSKWWNKNKKSFSLADAPTAVREGCLFVCGKAYPFLFLRSTAQIGSEGKGGQVRLSKYFNEAIKNSIAKEKPKYYWQQEEKNEEEYNFFKVYFNLEQYFDDVTIESAMPYFYRGRNTEKFHERELKKFFEFYMGKDFTALHLRLDSPLLLTLFEHKTGSLGNEKKEYEFLLNPNLYELDFIRIMQGEILLQELDMFLGNVLVKDVMPLSPQSDNDKLTAHGFDPKTSFRKQKEK